MHDTAELLEINTELHITPENEVQQKLDSLIKTTRNILEIESDTDEVSRFFLKLTIGRY